MDDDGEILEDTDDLLSTPFPSTYDEGAWRNVCDDFLDPLQDQFDRWSGRRPSDEADDMDVVHWLEELTYIVHAIATGVGSQDDCKRWNRARLELEVNVSADFAGQFEARAKKLFDAANAAVGEFSRCPPEDVAMCVDYLVCIEVEEFREYLRNVRLTLRGRNESGKRNSSGMKPKAKKKRGSPTKYDPKADKRIVDGWKSWRYKTYQDLEEKMGLAPGEVKRAIDRQRKR